MLRSLTFLTLAAAFSWANAQAPSSVSDAAPQAAPDQSQPPAPIVRNYQQHRARLQPEPAVESQPVAGVWLRSEPASVLKTISATPQRTEVRLERGVLNVNVHQPAQHSEILIDLPGGQTSLLKDGLYTFNADTNTVRVLRGEAAYVGKGDNSGNPKPIKIKEDHQISLVGSPGKAELKPVEAYPYELAADLIPPDGAGEPGHGEPGYPLYAGGYAPYYAPYPYFAGFYGYPYAYYPGFYGYPFAYGIGFGYYGRLGGYYRGGFRR